MGVLAEGKYLNEVLAWEMENNHSREIVTVLAGQVLGMGAVVGKIKHSVPTTGTAGSNTGTGVMQSVSGGRKTKLGTYTMVCIAAVTNKGTFEVKDPDGNALPEATATVAYVNDQINFTITDATDFIVGDSFSVTVAAGSGKVKELNLSGVDGSEDAYGILVQDAVATDDSKRFIAYTSGGVLPLLPGTILTGATSGATAQIVSFTLTGGTFAGGDAAGVLILDNQAGTFQSENLDSVAQANICSIGGNTATYSPDVQSVAIVRDAQVISDNLIWPSGITVAQIAEALAQLYDKGIVAREAA
jgi:hypothetical protein